jgi:hypothetical protein
MTRSAWIWNPGLFRLAGGDEAKRMGMDVVVLYGLLDLRHVAGDALAPGATLGVMCVLADGPFQSGRIFLGMA